MTIVSGNSADMVVITGALSYTGKYVTRLLLDRLHSRFHVFGIPGNGRYSIRPICVGDLARLIVDSMEQPANIVRDAVGPEVFTFEELVKLIAWQLGCQVRLVHLPVALAYVSTLLTGWWVRDVVLTREEYKGLMGNLLTSLSPSTGQTRLSEWLSKNREQVGRQYASEVARHHKFR